MRPIVYVAGPYSGGDPIHNTQRAVFLGRRLWTLGFNPYVPHLSMLSHIIHPENYEYWLEVGMEWVRHSQVLYRMRGDSPGADREVALANELEIPVFDDIFKLNSWFIDWKTKQG